MKTEPNARSLQRLVMTLALCLTLAGCDFSTKRIEWVIPPEKAAAAAEHFRAIRESNLTDEYCWSETRKMFGEQWLVEYDGAQEVRRTKCHNDVAHPRREAEGGAQ